MLTKSELKAWTDALRSGEYTQGQERLKTINPDGSCSHCCLGVLCEIEGLPQERFGLSLRFINSGTYLPDGLALKFGSDEGVFEEIGMPFLAGFNSIAQANDNGVPFSEIADHLDKYYPAV